MDKTSSVEINKVSDKSTMGEKYWGLDFDSQGARFHVFCQKKIKIQKIEM